MVEEFAFRVKLVTTPQSQIFDEEVDDNVHVPLPMFKVLAPVPVPKKLVVKVILLLFAEKSKAPVKAPIVRTERLRVAWLTVTVPPPELPSRVTLSPATGTDCPPAPPEDDAQWVVSAASHVPVPPTQNLFAMLGYALLVKHIDDEIIGSGCARVGIGNSGCSAHANARGKGNAHAARTK